MTSRIALQDIFGGFNAIFRGAVIKYKEYISVGKGRDVGFEQINGFEAKVSGARPLSVTIVKGSVFRGEAKVSVGLQSPPSL